ncbi:hypothetical protein Dsin_022154 [Dipteronia sinensis]|uniref:Uncharacterized protein n=1 Tax=Dipteronia sinensis TaxID=43782 RepID=A0AAE0A128_9ROSI|nr:hypothetical protein Dsin_022154 [Dipteronia sinensis]
MAVHAWVTTGRYVKEGIPALKVAIPDKLGMRCSGAAQLSDKALLMIRQTTLLMSELQLMHGRAMAGGESLFLNVQKRDLRMSRDWVGDRWVDIEAKPDIFSAISVLINLENKLSSTVTKDAKPIGLDASYTEIDNMDKVNAKMSPSLEQGEGEGGDDVKVSCKEVDDVQGNDAKEHDGENDDNGGKLDAEVFDTSEHNCKTTELMEVTA